MPNTPKFFITHSWHDIEFARRLCNDLRASGLDGFLDERSIRPGESIPLRIERGLKECDFYIPVFSPDALKSPWCDWEIDMAITMNRNRGGRPHIIPVIAKTCDVPDRLIHLLYVDFVGRYDDALNDLLTKGFGLPARSRPVPPALPTPSPSTQTKPALPIAPALRGRFPLQWLLPIGGALALVLIVACVLLSNLIASWAPPPSPTLGPVSTKVSEKDGAIMMYVPAGEFTMGSNDGDTDEKRVHTVGLDAFWIDKYEVTNAQYKKCVDDNGKCKPPNPTRSNTRDSYYGNPQFNDYPVIYVSWEDADTFCRWAGNKHLPTEAQWEKAASWDEVKKEKRVYPWGNTFDKNLLNSSEGGEGDTTAVGSYPGGASPYGAMDMAGNVWEWVADWYDDKYYANSPRNNPPGPDPKQYRVLRGGSWLDSQYYVRAAYRDEDSPDARDFDVGFRCAQ